MGEMQLVLKKPATIEIEWFSLVPQNMTKKWFSDLTKNFGIPESTKAVKAAAKKSD
jgi:hypothetical protein